MSDRFSPELRRKTMQAVRSSNTKLEEKVSRELWKRGLRFRKNVKDLFGKPDIAIKKYKVVIFIDSCFWHGCELHCKIPKNNRDYWLKKISRNKQRDDEVTSYYKERSWNIMRVWEHDLKIEFNKSIQSIVDLLDSIKNK